MRDENLHEIGHCLELWCSSKQGLLAGVFINVSLAHVR